MFSNFVCSSRGLFNLENSIIFFFNLFFFYLAKKIYKFQFLRCKKEGYFN